MGCHRMRAELRVWIMRPLLTSALHCTDSSGRGKGSFLARKKIPCLVISDAAKVIAGLKRVRESYISIASTPLNRSRAATGQYERVQRTSLDCSRLDDAAVVDVTFSFIAMPYALSRSRHLMSSPWTLVPLDSPILQWIRSSGHLAPGAKLVIPLESTDISHGHTT